MDLHQRERERRRKGEGREERGRGREQGHTMKCGYKCGHIINIEALQRFSTFFSMRLFFLQALIWLDSCWLMWTVALTSSGTTRKDKDSWRPFCSLPRAYVAMCVCMCVCVCGNIVRSMHDVLPFVAQKSCWTVLCGHLIDNCRLQCGHYSRAGFHIYRIFGRGSEIKKNCPARTTYSQF